MTGVWVGRVPLRAGEAWVESVRGQDVLRWRGERVWGKDETPWARCLDAFVDLADADSLAVASFAEQYGVPNLCRHGKPDTHIRTDAGPFRSGRCDLRVADGSPVVAVRHIKEAAAAFCACQEIVTRCRRGQQPPRWARAALGAWPQGMIYDDTNRHRQRVADWMTKMLRISGVEPLIRWPDTTHPTMEWEADGLMGILAERLRVEVALSDNSSFPCGVCGAAVWPDRAPKPGESVYHKGECRREANRLNTRRSRELRMRTSEETQP